MQVTLDWIHLAELAAALQGVVLAAALAAHRTNRTANRLLAALMGAFTLSLLAEVYYSAGLVAAYPHLFGLSYPMPWVFGPLVYLYAVAASDRRWRFHPRAALHFAPVGVILIITLPIYFQSGSEKIALFERLAAGDPPTRLLVLEPFKYISGLTYSVATLAWLRAHRRRVEHSYSNTGRVNLHWLQSLACAAAAIWLLASLVGIEGLVPDAVGRVGEKLVSLGVAVMVYAIGYMGLRQPEVFRYDGERETSLPASVPAAPASPPVRSPEPAWEPASEAGAAVALVQRSTLTTFSPAVRGSARYERSGLGELETKRLKVALLALMAEQHPYRDPELTLAGLAERLDSTPHKLSELLNRELSMTFFDFVNGYRVDEVRERLADPRTRNRNILGLGLDAGFASKSTFNQAFRKMTGQTPSTYRKALEERKALAG
jgi:AraC-like DNA-binding protein